MAGQLTLWGAGELLRSFFGRTAEPPPSFYLALVRTIAPTPYISGLELDEPPAESGYARVELPNDVSTWSSAGQLHVVSNDKDATFITATSDWGRIGYWALVNADEGGYVYFVGEMEETKTVLAGDQAMVPTDELVVELGPFFATEDF